LTNNTEQNGSTLLLRQCYYGDVACRLFCNECFMADYLVISDCCYPAVFEISDSKRIVVTTLTPSVSGSRGVV